MWQQTEKPSSVTPKALSMGTELRDGGGPSGRDGAEPRGGGQRIPSGSEVSTPDPSLTPRNLILHGPSWWPSPPTEAEPDYSGISFPLGCWE